MPLGQYPEVIHAYQNHLLDSTHWNHYLPRDDDIIIATSYKSGTTWMQNIIFQLITLEQTIPAVSGVSPWLDYRLATIDEVIEQLEAQKHRRYIKTHLPLDGLPFHPQVKYIVVGRSPLDVFMSLWNHYSNHTDEFVTQVNEHPGRVGDPFPPAPLDIHEFWRSWIGRGWFEWESEGYPYWSNMYHIQTWWDYRDLDNILFVHFNDLLANLEQEIERIASFVEIEASTSSITTIAQEVSFSTAKRRAIESETDSGIMFKEGVKTFFFKGTNGRWKGVLSEAELAMYEETKGSVLTPECALWLEEGRVALV